jgi:hypothetical protein
MDHNDILADLYRSFFYNGNKNIRKKTYETEIYTKTLDSKNLAKSIQEKDGDKWE